MTVSSNLKDRISNAYIYSLCYPNLKSVDIVESKNYLPCYVNLKCVS